MAEPGAARVVAANEYPVGSYEWAQLVKCKCDKKLAYHTKKNPMRPVRVGRLGKHGANRGWAGRGYWTCPYWRPRKDFVIEGCGFFQWEAMKKAMKKEKKKREKKERKKAKVLKAMKSNWGKGIRLGKGKHRPAIAKATKRRTGASSSSKDPAVVIDLADSSQEKKDEQLIISSDSEGPAAPGPEEDEVPVPELGLLKRS